jgi:hypothetical protein
MFQLKESVYPLDERADLVEWIYLAPELMFSMAVPWDSYIDEFSE